MIEQVGSGIDRIRDLIKSAKLPEPEFKTDGMFTVVFHSTVEETVEETVEKTPVEIILSKMEESPKITIKSVRVKFGQSSEKIVLLI